MTKTDMEHTPGPWDYDQMDFTVYALDNFDPIPIPVTEANARLMAAAPSMLAALVTVENTLFDVLKNCKFDSPDQSGLVVDTLVAVKSAITRAKEG